MEYEKIYVSVAVRFPQEGGMRPLYIEWENGRRFSIGRIKFIEHASARVGSVLPVRYTCVIAGKEKFLYFEPEEQRWFVESPVLGQKVNPADKELSDTQS